MCGLEPELNGDLQSAILANDLDRVFGYGTAGGAVQLSGSGGSGARTRPAARVSSLGYRSVPLSLGPPHLGATLEATCPLHPSGKSKRAVLVGVRAGNIVGRGGQHPQDKFLRISTHLRYVGRDRMVDGIIGWNRYAVAADLMQSEAGCACPNNPIDPTKENQGARRVAVPSKRRL